jgi:sulfoxide reductase heme-binding subunit YedZ
MTLWYLARAAGLSALIALSVATALGALVSGRSTALGRRVVVQYVHRAAALFGALLMLLHVGAMVLDAKSGISLSTVVIPFTSSYRPLAVALGSIAMYLLLLVAVTGMARGRMASSPRGARAWRSIHLSAYVLWGIAALHGFFAGSDSSLGWVRALYILLVAGVFGSVAVRLSSHLGWRRTPLAVARARSAAVVPVPARAHGGRR